MTRMKVVLSTSAPSLLSDQTAKPHDDLMLFCDTFKGAPACNSPKHRQC